LDVVLKFRSKGLIPPAIVHLCRWHHRLSPGEALPQNGALSVTFAACLYPRRIFHLTGWERWRRFQCFLEVFRQPGLQDAMAVVRCLRALGRLPDRTSDDLFLTLLNDMSALENLEDQQERTERLAGAALKLATHQREAFEREVRGEESRGILRNWSDDKSFVRFLRLTVPTPPSRRCSHIEAQSNGTPFWGGIQNALSEELNASEPDHIKKVVELEQMLWRRRPDRVAPEDFKELIVDFWQEQNRKLLLGFQHYAFESHFVRWWQSCVNNLKNLIHRTPPGQHVALPKPSREVHKNQPRLTAEPPAIQLTPELLRNIREGWRLIRTTFVVRGGLNPTKDNDALREVLDELWQYHLEKNICQSAPNVTIKEIAARTSMNVNTAFTQVKRIGNRHMAYNLARLRGMTNSEIGRRLEEAGAEVELVHRTVASLARPVDRGDSLFWAFTAHVFFHAHIDQMHPDAWNFKRCTEEFSHWVDDPSFLSTVHRMAIAGARLHRKFLTALVGLMNGPSDVLASLGSDVQREEETVEDAIEKLHAQVMNKLRAVNNETYQDTDGRMHRWARSLVDDVVGGSGFSVYENSRSLFALTVPKLGDHSEWIVPTWYLIFVEGLPLDAEVIISRLNVDPEDQNNVRRIVKSLRLHCNEWERSSETR
jgi:hypothetical protein